jgi:hypothetical protein
MIVVSQDLKSRARCVFCLEPPGTVILTADDQKGYSVSIHICEDCALGFHGALDSMFQSLHPRRTR